MSHDNLAARISEKAEIRIEDMTLGSKSGSAPPILLTEPVIDPTRGRHRLEDEIVALFDQFRDPLLRYLSSFGVSVPDGEELIQESFLSLFKHLRAGKPRENLRGWLFRVTHNLALKERYRAHRSLDAMTESIPRNNRR